MTISTRRLAAVAAAFLLLAHATYAQVFPSRGDTPVTDDADIIDAETEARLVERLNALKAETGADVAVVTLISTAMYTGGEDLDLYAGLLFDALGLAAVPEGKAAMLLVFRDDRELRIETGPAYGEDSSALAAGIISDLIVPQFQSDAYAAGIEAGVGGIIDRIVAPPADPAREPTPEDGGSGLWWLLGLFVVPIGAVVYAARRRAAKLAARPCPSCGKTGLTEASVIVQPATVYAEGKGETRTTCPHCGNVTAVPYAISKVEPKEKDKSAQLKPADAKAAAGKEGAKQQGGGASGNW